MEVELLSKAFLTSATINKQQQNKLDEQDSSELTVIMGNAANLYHISTEKKLNIYPPLKKTHNETQTYLFMIRSTEREPSTYTT